jgi:hypothetical protein
MLRLSNLQIGEGGYAFVYLATPVPTGGAAAEPVAIKKVGLSTCCMSHLAVTSTIVACPKRLHQMQPRLLLQALYLSRNCQLSGCHRLSSNKMACVKLQSVRARFALADICSN